jgi:hypothetical protein
MLYYNYSGEWLLWAEAMNVNIVNNFYKPGPASPIRQQTRYELLPSTKKLICQPAMDFIPSIMCGVNSLLMAMWSMHRQVPQVANKRFVTMQLQNNWDYGAYNQFASQYGAVSASR